MSSFRLYLSQILPGLSMIRVSCSCRVTNSSSNSSLLTENSAQLLRWMVSGPKIARLVNECQVHVSLVKLCEEKIENKRHHEKTNGVQKKFKKFK